MSIAIIPLTAASVPEPYFSCGEVWLCHELSVVWLSLYNWRRFLFSGTVEKMPEGLSSFSPENSAESADIPESQFGDKEKTLNILENGRAHVLGSIEEMYPETPAHANLVQMAKLIASERDKQDAVNYFEPVIVKTDEANELLAIFKPASGENETSKRQTELNSFYSREHAAYLISEHFGFDLVPPTVVREINNQIGSLQWFLPPENYAVVNEDSLSSVDWDRIVQSPDFLKLGLFDAIAINIDRHDNNYMVEGEKKPDGFALDHNAENHARLAAIDNGLILDTPFYYKFHAQGPMLNFTYNNKTEMPKVTPLPDNLLKSLVDGYRHKDELDFASLPDIDPSEIDKMWKRVNQMIEYKAIISKYNLELIKNRPQ
jgi:hypothetical protein